MQDFKEPGVSDEIAAMRLQYYDDKRRVFTKQVEDISGAKEELDHGNEHVWSTGSAFLAQLKSGKAMAWGHPPTVATSRT